MRCSHFSPHQPRRGQALLLAVLIMIFAALLSASFIAIVSVNLNQTARQTDKNRAVVSAQAGMEFIKNQLAYSDEGERWRPQLPSQSDPGYGLYYTALDRAQGWADQYAKFPDPRNATGLNVGPQYLAKVERVPYTTTASSPDFDKVGALKVTVIGLSPEDPSAYSRLVFYKGGYQNSPIAQNMRVVSNWDFKNSVVPVAQAADYAPITRIITLKNIKGNFPEPPFAVMIGDPRSIALVPTKTTRGAVVIAKTVTGTTTQFTLASPGATAIVGSEQALAVGQNERIELAASLGAPNGLNYNNDTRPVAVATPIATPVIIADKTTSGGVRVNGGLWLTGIASSDGLRVPKDAYGASLLPPAAIEASGMFGREISTTATRFEVHGTAITGANNDLLSSFRDTFPGTWTMPSTYDARSRDQLVSDGWNRLAGVPNNSTTNASNLPGTRMVSNFIPPAIDSGENLERYRRLTRFSPPATTGDPVSASFHGYGQGIYIDNVQDRERVYATVEPDTNGNGILEPAEDLNSDGFRETKTGYRDMTQAELVNMWLSRPLTASPTPTDYMRTGTPVSLNSTAASLEQQHVRGWVGPDEFRARGVEVELGNNSITITRDARDDNRALNPDATVGTSNAIGLVAAKTWKLANGTAQSGVYRQTLAWPANGVLFAEGNVRIRGNATNAPRSLTVVSMGNIYIENSISVDDAVDDAVAADGSRTTVGQPRKVMLAAVKNVVMNPTRAMGRPDAQTIANPSTPQTVAVGANATLSVADGLSFQKGDFIQASTVALGTETVVARGYITALPTANQLTFTATLGGSVANGTLVRTPTSIMQSVASTLVAAKRIPFTSIKGSADALQRRLDLTNVPNNAALANLRLAFSHQADRVPAFSVNVDDADVTAPVYFSNKGVYITPPAATAPYLNASATVIAAADKRIRAQYTNPTAGVDDFPGVVPSNPSAPTAPTSDTEATSPTRNLATISGAMNTTTHPTVGPPPTDWSYTTSTPTAGYSTLPFFYLAGVGNRIDFPFTTNLSPIVAGLETRPNINKKPYVVPLANSISVFANGVLSPLSNEHWNASLATPRYDRTDQFGFKTAYTDTSDPSEDVLTGDQSFYQADLINSTLDSRQLSNGLVAGFNSVFLKQSDGLIPLVGTATYPEYRLEGLKLENVGLVNGTDTVNTVAPAYTFNVNAYVYAQTGSWFVIPSGLFDDRLKSIAVTGGTTTFLDINNSGSPDAGESLVDGSTGNSYPDLNRNGIVDDAERYAMARYSRYNYQINFVGAITENQTPLVNSMRGGTGLLTDPIVANGAVEAWMNSWSTVNKLAGGAPTNGRMTYTFDDDYAMGLLENDIGFRLPQTPEVFNVS